MFLAETIWLARMLERRRPEELSPLLNIGSSTRAFRETDQPWIEKNLFAPLVKRGIEVVHLDARDGDGIDIRANILAVDDLARIRSRGAKAILCCNLLEHVLDPQQAADHCVEIVGPGGYIFVTVPFSYPRHRDPIDTLYRPNISELKILFRKTDMVVGEIIDTGESYLDQVKRRPLLIFRHIFRFPFPFYRFEDWYHSIRKVYWLFSNYRVTCAVFQVPREEVQPQLTASSAGPS